MKEYYQRELEEWLAYQKTLEFKFLVQDIIDYLRNKIKECEENENL